MKNYDNQYSILLYEIKKLPDSEIKREFYIDLERAIKSLDNEYKENIIKALFMRIDFIKKELNLNNHDENSYYIDKKKISTSTISKSETQVNSFFAISSLITSVILDSCNDIKYIRNSPFISKRIDKLIDEIHDEMISINNNQKEKLKNAFASKMKLEEIRTFIENYNNNEDNINDIYDKLLSIYNDKINSYLDKLNKVYEKMNDYEQDVFDTLKKDLIDIIKFDKKIRLEKYNEYLDKFNSLYNYMFDRNISIDNNEINDEIDEITILIATDLKNIKRHISSDTEKYYERIIEQLKNINKTTKGINKFIKLDNLRKEIDLLKITLITKKIKIDEKSLYKNMYNYYIRKIDDELQDVLIENICNKEVIDKYFAFKESIKSNDEDVNLLIENIIILQNMKERIKIDERIKVKA